MALGRVASLLARPVDSVWSPGAGPQETTRIADSSAAARARSHIALKF